MSCLGDPCWSWFPFHVVPCARSIACTVLLPDRNHQRQFASTACGVLGAINCSHANALCNLHIERLSSCRCIASSVGGNLNVSCGGCSLAAIVFMWHVPFVGTAGQLPCACRQVIVKLVCWLQSQTPWLLYRCSMMISHGRASAQILQGMRASELCAASQRLSTLAASLYCTCFTGPCTLYT